jgi:uncharacterized protein involved in response to NO
MDDHERTTIPILSLGFRPFFLGAAVYAAFAMSFWLAVYEFGLSIDFHGLSPSVWHAHEMVFGYGLAVIAGFLLTAVKNWTGRSTLHGAPLLLLFLFWLCARLAFYLPGPGIHEALVCDALFAAYLAVGILRPIAAARQWKQTGIVVSVLLLGAGNLLFYLGALDIIGRGVHWGLYTGFYSVIGLILILSRRLIPFFVERGVGYPVELRNSDRLDIAVLIGFLAFFAVEVFAGNQRLSAALAGLLLILNLVRLVGWHTRGIWRKPLLWSLYLSHAFLILGFGLFAASVWLDILRFPALHAFAVGGVGLVTLSMMSRVSLGHTGRDINRLPGGMSAFLLILLVAAVVRVLLPPLLPQLHSTWILVSQLLWITAFSGFAALYLPILARASLPADTPH